MGGFFVNSCNIAHGIMFHHFHDDVKHIKEQGSITAETLEHVLDFCAERYNILLAEEYFDKAQKGKLKKRDICLTFDDSLLCQYDIAAPVLKRRNLTAFYFIYTSPLEGEFEKLEIYRHFRFFRFKNIDDFYQNFFEFVQKEGLQYKNDDAQNYRKECGFYTENDRIFRYLRDLVLEKEKYDWIMNKMMEQYDYDPVKYVKDLWMDKKMINSLHSDGNVIGLHTHTHPTTLNKMSYDEQKNEFLTNKDILESIIKKPIKTVSYPCDSYNMDTIEIMHELKICVGFRAVMSDKYEALFIPRQDHANILKIINARK